MTDWRALIMRLERRLTHLDIATYCDRSEGWVGMLKRGIIKEPPYEQGRLLHELDAEHERQRAALINPRETQDPQVRLMQSA